MQRLLCGFLCLLLLRAAPVAGQRFLNVHAFGAKGDGKSDDADAINLALKAAHSEKKSLYFPAGVYLCNQVNKAGHILEFEADGLDGIRLYGDSNSTRITTSLNAGSILLYVWAYAKSDGLTVKDIFFENTHRLIAKPTQGLFLQGTKGENLTNVHLTGCRFEGFSNAVGGQGVKGWNINKNIFNAPKGHDDAKNDSEPAVFLWFYDNSNGYCTDVRIAGNTADGYSGSGPISGLITKRAMDGFVYGTGYGFTITNNKTMNFSEEHYALAPKATFKDDTSHTLIENNHMDGTIPPGSMDDNGSKKHLSNYGIRCDISNVVIHNNVIRNYTYGIIVRGVETPNAKIHTYEISGNKLFAAEDTANYQIEPAILIQGNLNNRIKNVQITGNEIHVSKVKRARDSYEGIAMYDMEKGSVESNSIIANKHAEDSRLTAISYSRVGQMTEKANQVVGMNFRRILSRTDTVQIIADSTGKKSSNLK